MDEQDEDRVTYEHPLNERLRTLLRLEFLIKTAATAMQRPAAIDSRTAVEAFIHTLQLLDRGEVRSEVIKELDRLSGSLARRHESGGPRPSAPPQEETEQCRALLRRVGEPGAALGETMREDELLILIAQRFGIGASTCGFDLPSYHRWLSRPYEERLTDMQRWYESFSDLRAAVLFALRMQRQSAPFTEQVAEQGSWQRRTSSTDPAIQLLRLRTAADRPVIPEISGNRYFLTIRFLSQPDTTSRPQPIAEDLPFELACCTL
ncbi:cell division protein ZapD [Halorhodospira abdelmalekii]|uniref:cell division protein ZapD n=1 Tax=Halorhodospira abdelmalekii TaxID=421629 RepID=UPI001905D983|nr:cell division protein ZapD [Halorhodospira abdelmalekii]